MIPSSQPAGLADSPHAAARLMLFVAGDEPNSRLAKENLARILETVPDKRYKLEIIDVFDDYRPALEHVILVTPCLLVLSSTPSVRVVGSLSDTKRVRAALRFPNE